MLNKQIKVHLKCDAFMCGYEWEGTEEEYNKMMTYDGESLNHFPTRKEHIAYISLKEGQCPACVQFEERRKLPPEPPIRGGVIPSLMIPRFPRRIK
jgi:hypothetical protein